MRKEERPLTAATVNGPRSNPQWQSNNTAPYGQQQNDLAGFITSVHLPAVAEAAGVALTKRGNRYLGLCPFHDEKTPSFSVYKKDGKWRYKCFGCGAGGDALDFVQKAYGLDFKGAMENLGLSDGYRPKLQPVKPKQKHSFRWSRYQPLTDEDTAYLKSRGLVDGTIQRFHGADILKHGTVNGNCAGMVISLRSLPGRDLEAVQGIPVNGGIKEFQFGSSASQGFFICPEREHSRQMIITEAAIDAMSVWQALPSVNVISICGATLTKKLNQLNGDEADTVTLFMDNDPAGKQAAELSAQILGNRFHDVRVVDYGDVKEKDPNDLLQDGKGEIMRRLVDEAVPVSYLDDHPEPKLLPDELLPVEPFDFKMMPDTLAPWAKDIADRMKCPSDYVAVTVMAMVGAVVGGKIRVRPKAEDNWEETPNQWAMLVGRPSTLKSPAMEEALKPLRRLEAKAGEAYNAQVREYKADTEAEEILYGQKKKKAKSATSKDEIKRLLLKPEALEQPKRKRYRTNDSTAAALGKLLVENSNGLLVYRDELASLLGELDREENAGARGFYLSGWNGTGGYIIDRIGRGLYLDIPSVTISLLGSTQPGRISGYIKRALSGGAGDDGLLQRFGLTVWPDNDRSWKDVDRIPDKGAQQAAYSVIEYLDTLNPLEIGAEQETGYDGEAEGIPCLRFDLEALTLFREWRFDLENRQLRDDDIHPALESHLAKYRKLVPTLALLVHLAEYGNGPITKTALLKALSWSEYLKSHAKRMYSSITSPDVATAKRIIKRIKRGDLKSPFVSRDVYRKGWSGLTGSKDVVDGLQMLVDYEWLFIEMEPTKGKTATIYTAHPKLVIS